MTRPWALPPFDTLREPERVALGMAASGLTNAEIADRMGCGLRSVATYLARAREVAGVDNERALIAWHWGKLAMHVEQRQCARWYGS